VTEVGALFGVEVGVHGAGAALAGAARRAWSTHATVLRRWAVEVRVFTHAHVSMITYRVEFTEVGR